MDRRIENRWPETFKPRKRLKFATLTIFLIKLLVLVDTQELISNNFWPEVFYIPQAGETINLTSYISMRVTIDSALHGQLMVIDEGSGQQLLRYRNTEKTIPRVPYNFTSDSNKVRIEIRLPPPPSNKIPYQNETIKQPISATNKAGKITKKFTNFTVTILYFEVPFSNHSVDLEADVSADRYREVVYKQNSVITYKLQRTGRESERGVQIKLETLDIEMGSGDFILIGAGNKPQFRELARAHLISTNIQNPKQQKWIWVDADSAYIRLVTHKSRHLNRTALRFSWIAPPEISGIVEEKEKYPERIKNAAIQICILGHSCQAVKNLYEREFKLELTDIANEYLVANMHESTLINVDKVILFDYENGTRHRQQKSDIYCQANLVIVNSYDWPIMPYKSLHHLFFRDSTFKDMHSFGTVRVTDCSHTPLTLWNMILPIIVILIVSILLMLVAWRYQYRIWIRVQQANNRRNYNNVDIEEENIGKDNPSFDTPSAERKANANAKAMPEFTDSQNFIVNDRVFVRQISQISEFSDKTDTSLPLSSKVSNVTKPHDNKKLEPIQMTAVQKTEAKSVTKTEAKTEPKIATKIEPKIEPIIEKPIDNRMKHNADNVIHKLSPVLEVRDDNLETDREFHVTKIAEPPPQQPKMTEKSLIFKPINNKEEVNDNNDQQSHKIIRMDSSLSDTGILPSVSAMPTDINGTQHASLRALKPALKIRPRLVSEGDSDSDSSTIHKLSRVQFAPIPTSFRPKPKQATILSKTISSPIQ